MNLDELKQKIRSLEQLTRDLAEANLAADSLATKVQEDPAACSSSLVRVCGIDVHCSYQSAIDLLEGHIAQLQSDRKRLAAEIAVELD